MLLHNLTIAFRNMWKYKSQTLISIIGLAVGFTCFALATLWIVYEMTFDNFHKNAKNMYVIYIPDLLKSSPTDYNRGSSITTTSFHLAANLKETFPEIANAISVRQSPYRNKVRVDGIEIPASVIRADTAFFSMFDVKILEGSRDFLIPGSQKYAITRDKARQLFGNEPPIGKKINNGEICAIISDLPKRSNYRFDFIGSFSFIDVDPNRGWNYSTNTIIELLPGVNRETFEKKLYEYKFRGEKLSIMPITKLRYNDPSATREVSFQHIVIFAVSGILVILCSLFNYLTLFVSRFRLRQKEFALREVFGASGRSLLAMLSVEFILTLLIASIAGFILTEIVYEPFLILSDIQMTLPAIYRELLMYVGCIILISLPFFWMLLFFYRRKSMNESIRRGNSKLFRKVSLVAQLLISIGFVFSISVILKQMYFLHHTTELGFSFKSRGSITIISGANSDVLTNQLKQIPEITEVIDATALQVLLPLSGYSSTDVYSWDDKPADTEYINIFEFTVSPEYSAFYDFKLIAGEMLTDVDPESMVLLNESAVKAFGWHDPVGKQFDGYRWIYTVKGVIKNIYNFAPTVPAKPYSYTKPDNERINSLKGRGSATVIFKYREGMWKLCKEKIDQLIQKEYAESTNIRILNSEEEYDKFLKSENALIKLLSFVSAICIMICVFGFVSLVSLTCEERRKEIAIRKINGATVGDILSIFAKEYFLLLMIGAVIAFSAGYFIMQRWLENYVKQTSIPVWIYLAIIFALALVIVLCVGWQVYRASVENPAETVKS